MRQPNTQGKERQMEFPQFIDILDGVGHAQNSESPMLGE
jgi:hypothetical protein